MKVLPVINMLHGICSSTCPCLNYRAGEAALKDTQHPCTLEQLAASRSLCWEERATFAPCSVPSRIIGGRLAVWARQHSAVQAPELLASNSCCCTHSLPALPASAWCILHWQQAIATANVCNSHPTPSAPSLSQLLTIM